MNTTQGLNMMKSGEKKLTGSKGNWRKVVVLALVGGLAFWLTNFAISRTLIAAEYRAALSISYYPMLLEALIGGLIIGVWVSYFLLRFYDWIPAKNPMLKSVSVSLIVLVIVTISIGNPSSFKETNDVLRYFTIGTIFNFIRILALGVTVGYVCKKRYLGSTLSVSTSNITRIN